MRFRFQRLSNGGNHNRFRTVIEARHFKISHFYDYTCEHFTWNGHSLLQNFPKHSLVFIRMLRVSTWKTYAVHVMLVLFTYIIVTPALIHLPGCSRLLTCAAVRLVLACKLTPLITRLYREMHYTLATLTCTHGSYWFLSRTKLRYWPTVVIAAWLPPSCEVTRTFRAKYKIYFTTAKRW